MNLRFVIYGCILGMAALVGAYYKGVWDTKEEQWRDAKSVRAQDVQIARSMQPQLTHTIIQAGSVTAAILPRIPYATSHFKATETAPVTLRPGYFLTGADIVCWNSALDATTPECPAAPVQAPGAATASGHH